MNDRVLELDVQGKTVLVVEDEFFLADDLAQALQDAGIGVAGPVATCDAALKLIDEAPVAFAILDVNLEEEKIFPVADELIARGVPFLFATGYGQNVLPERFREIPRWEKPYDTDALVRTLCA